MIKKIVKIGAVFSAMLFVSLAIVPTVMAQADFQNIDTPKNVKILKDTTDVQVASIQKSDGTIGYVIAWKDTKDSKRVNFKFVSQNELMKKLNNTTKSATISNDLVVATLLQYTYNFGDGSYVTFTGDTKTGTVKFHLTADDATWIVGGGSSAAYILMRVLKLIPEIDLIAAAVTLISDTIYRFEKNSDGSLDIKIPLTYVYPTVGLVTMLIGKHWYNIYY